MIDTHCHLTDPRLYDQLQAVLDRAHTAGVDGMITIGTGIADAELAIRLCREHPAVHCCIGIHPNYVHQADLPDVERLGALQRDPSVLGLGEMGLDYHYNFAPRDRQRLFFEAQLQLAADLNRAVVIHCRDAVDDTLAILAQFPTIRAVFHCFTGTSDEARRIVDRGFLLGFTGPVTFKKSDDLRQAVRQAPLEAILVETDAPYLSPEPVRKIKTNEPAFVMHTAATVASLKQVELPELEHQVLENVHRLFGRGF